MLRASQVSSRQRLAQLLLDADRPCLRLFLDYHGLRVLSTWMQVKNLFFFVSFLSSGASFINFSVTLTGYQYC